MTTSVYIGPKVRKLRQLYGQLFDATFYSLPITRQLELQAQILARAHQATEGAVCFQIASWHPRLRGRSDEEILEFAFTMEDAKATVAREHGFQSWSEVDAGSSDVGFERAVDTMLSGDLAALKEQVAARPDLVQARSRYGHGATVLHYAGSNGVESYRQVVPLNLADIVDFLIRAGADPQAEATIYGGSTARALFESSTHPIQANVHEKVAAVFQEHGA